MPSFELVVATDLTSGIAKNGKIPWYLPEDLKQFKKLTIGNGNNAVVMGRKTWESLPHAHRPLSDRLNIVMTRGDSDLPLPNDVRRAKSVGAVLHMTRYNDKVFVIGGKEIYALFAPYITRVHHTFVDGNFDCDTVFDVQDLLTEMTLCKTEPFKGFVKYTFEKRAKQQADNEGQYLNLLRKVLSEGRPRQDRTGTGTLSLFAPPSLDLDVSTSIPLLTTKKMPWKSIVKELLWFLRGDTDAKVLQRQGVHIWDGNTSKEFIAGRGLSYEPGIAGPIYGFQWRHFGARYDPAFADTTTCNVEIGGFDQLEYVVHELRTSPHSRRAMMSAWNPPDLQKSVLPPCHVSAQFYLDNGRLSCHMYQRSADVFLGLPFNIASYTVLLYILAIKLDVEPHRLVVSIGDVHVYNNHLDQCREQLGRDILAPPRLVVNRSVKEKDWSDISVDDFVLEGYHSHEAIRAPMAV